MLHKLRLAALVILLSAAAVHMSFANAPPQNRLSPEQTYLVQKAIVAEKATIREIQRYSPVVQTYIQNFRPDQSLIDVPESDQYFLGRVDFAKSIGDSPYASKAPRKALFNGSMNFVSGLSNALKMQSSSAGFMEMLFLDPASFDQEHYDFSYVRRDFLGAVRTLVFDVDPKPGTGSGRFAGRIWIEDQGGNIVRFNGTYTRESRDESNSRSIHFDSWRENLQPGLWLPVGLYVGESGKIEEHAVSFKSQTYLWGYGVSLPAHDLDSETFDIAKAEDETDSNQDVSPLAAQREWIAQAETNVLDRLVQAGLLAPSSDFDRVLEQVANNIISGNNIPLSEPIRCRVLLTAPLESLAVSNTIILSKGLIDVLPAEADLAAVVSFQLAHIVLGHRIDTRYAFNDRLLFPDDATFARIHMSHSDADNELAARKAIDLLNHSLYAGQLSQPGLFLAQLQARSKQLTALSTPRLGDSLLRPTGEPWLNALIAKAPKLDINNPDQIAALPLGSNLKIDAWDDKVIRLSAGKSPTLSARDKMPFEVTPVFFRLAGFGSATSDPAAAKFEKKIVRIFFATDRAPGEDMQNVQQFTGERAANDELVFGSADVSIPPGHTMGVVESPSWIRLRVKFDTNKDVVLIEARRLPASDFMASLDGQVRDDPKHEALVFVHGYNVSFEDAARRLGQITYDLGFAGAPILYSWPSEGSLIGYSADEANVEWSSPHFLKFLQMLRQDHGIDTVYVLAHSMGNRLVTSAFRNLAQDGAEANAKFRDVIMAAPDVDAGVFKQLAEQIRQAVPHITIYESSNDLALSFSHRFHRYPRLGDTDPNVHVFENYECIVATSVDTSLLGHSYIGDSPSILADIFDLLMTQTPASRRFRLQQYSLGGLPYWAFRK